MEFLSGSSLSPTDTSTPQELRFWGSSSNNILRRHQQPESYTTIQFESDPFSRPRHNKISQFNNFALTNHHDDTHHYGIELVERQVPLYTSSLIKQLCSNSKQSQHSQHAQHAQHAQNFHHIPPNSPPSPHCLPPSASTSQLPSKQAISINNVVYPYFPLSTTHQSRPLSGPLIIKFGLDPDLVDIDMSLRVKDRVIVRGSCVVDHKAVSDKMIITQKEMDEIYEQYPLPVGVDRGVVTDGSGYMIADQRSQGSLGGELKKVTILRKNAFEKLFEKHSLKKALNPSTVTIGGDITYNAPTYSLGVKYTTFDHVVGGHLTKSFTFDQNNNKNDENNNKNNFFTQNPFWFVPSAIDMGVEYHIKVEDLQDTFTIGTIATWDEYHQGLSYPNIKQWEFRQPDSEIEHRDDPKNQNDIITTSTIPTSISLDVNGIGTLAVAFTTSLYDSVKRTTPPPSSQIEKTLNIPHSTSYPVPNELPIRYGTPSEFFSAGDHHHGVDTGRFDKITFYENHQTSFFPSLSSFLPTILTDVIDLYSMGVYDYIVPILGKVFWGNDQNYEKNQILSKKVEGLSHSAMLLSSKIEYSIGSRESGYQFGLQRVNHVFERETQRGFDYYFGEGQDLKENEQNFDNVEIIAQNIDNFEKIKINTKKQLLNPIIKTPMSIKSVKTPWSMTSSSQTTFSFSTTKGVGLDYTFEYSPPTRNMKKNSLQSEKELNPKSNFEKFPTNYSNDIFSPPSNSRFYFNFGLSKLLPFQLTDHFFRTHHSFPLLPLPHQPYTEIDATPCSQDPAMVKYFSLNGINQIENLQQQNSKKKTSQKSPSAPHISPQSWYPADYTFPTAAANTTHTQLNDSTTSLTPTIVPSVDGNDIIDYSRQSVNSDDVTRRLSLCSHNGEWKGFSRSGATPTPIWNPFEGVKVNVSFGVEM
jgi:hypothetical protein